VPSDSQTQGSSIGKAPQGTCAASVESVSVGFGTTSGVLSFALLGTRSQQLGAHPSRPLRPARNAFCQSLSENRDVPFGSYPYTFCPGGTPKATSAFDSAPWETSFGTLSAKSGRHIRADSGIRLPDWRNSDCPSLSEKTGVLLETGASWRSATTDLRRLNCVSERPASTLRQCAAVNRAMCCGLCVLCRVTYVSRRAV